MSRAALRARINGTGSESEADTRNRRSTTRHWAIACGMMAVYGDCYGTLHMPRVPITL